MQLAYADDQPPVRRDAQVGVTRSRWRVRFRSEGLGLIAVYILAIETLVVPISKVDGGAVHAIVTAALILVDARAHVEALRCHLDQATVCAASHDNVAAALTGPTFDPIEVIFDDLKLPQAHSARSNQRRCDR
jgi:hypothetical protein